MSQEVMIAGAVFSDVPSIRVPDSNNVFHSFTDVTDTTATASDVASGKYFYAADGTRTAGTSSGGGGGGFEYETGLYEPEETVSNAWISFAKTHDTPPSIVYIGDIGAEDTLTDTNTRVSHLYVNYKRLIGSGFLRNSTQVYYGYISSFGRNTGTSVSATTNSLTTADTDSAHAAATSNSRYWATESEFHFINTSTFKAVAGRTYKWVAIWATV